MDIIKPPSLESVLVLPFTQVPFEIVDFARQARDECVREGVDPEIAKKVFGAFDNLPRNPSAEDISRAFDRWEDAVFSGLEGGNIVWDKISQTLFSLKQGVSSSVNKLLMSDSLRCDKLVRTTITAGVKMIVKCSMSLMVKSLVGATINTNLQLYCDYTSDDISFSDSPKLNEISANFAKKFLQGMTCGRDDTGGITASSSHPVNVGTVLSAYKKGLTQIPMKELQNYMTLRTMETVSRGAKYTIQSIRMLKDREEEKAISFTSRVYGCVIGALGKLTDPKILHNLSKIIELLHGAVMALFSGDNWRVVDKLLKLILRGPQKVLVPLINEQLERGFYEYIIDLICVKSNKYIRDNAESITYGIMYQLMNAISIVALERAVTKYVHSAENGF
jgi:hypothetical protein